MRIELYVFIVSLLFANCLWAIPITKDMSNADTAGLFKAFGKNKILPKANEQQALLALSFYPELINTKIEFRLVDDIVPLTTTPIWWQIVKSGKNRTYLILISFKSNKLLTPILLENLEYNAQIGVLAHELSHVVEFQEWNFFNFIYHILMNLSSKYVDTFEYNTDKRTISHGLGYQLRAWSVDTRKKLDLSKFISEEDINNGRERYMNPETIDKLMLTNPLYAK
ncbi:MAG: hypothetical protein SFY32_07995 [Bacteroidota bacterium]|nr:hypothetical protein [Bacteroidota bacterium]